MGCCAAAESTNSTTNVDDVMNDPVMKDFMRLAERDKEREDTQTAYIKADGTVVLPMNKFHGFVSKEIPPELWIHERIQSDKVLAFIMRFEEKSKVMSGDPEAKPEVSRQLQSMLQTWNEETLLKNGVSASLVFLADPEPHDIGIHLKKVDPVQASSTVETNEAPPAYGET